MVDRRRQRSADPADRAAFAPQALPRLREAVGDLSWLVHRGYLERTALGLVGDRYALTRRQREAVARCACPAAQREALEARRVGLDGLRGGALAIDGFNVLVTLETALGGGAVLLARDGCARDVRGVRGTWRRTAETAPAIEAVGEVLARAAVGPVAWVLDHGVSNSGRLRALLLEAAERSGRPWSVEVREDADARLAAASQIVASADREVLARCGRWVSLAREVVVARVPAAWVVDLT
jgi:hypothetical protein